jgi:pimeloyl-ACP methyl ester carboxylesterase
MQLLFENSNWQVMASPGPAGDLVIAFASVGHDPSRAPSPEFVASAGHGGRAALFVIDKTRSWGTAPGLEHSLRAALATTGAQRVLCVGASMGGAVALRAAGMIGVDAVLAIGAQHQPAAPWETRWRDWTRALPPDLTTPLPSGQQITLLHGMEDDTPQAMGFATRKDVDHILFPALAHSALAPHLKSMGLLAGLIEAALQNDRRRLLRLTARAGGIRRV